MAHAPARGPMGGGSVADGWGIALVAVLAAWVASVAGGGAGRPAPVVLLLTALVVALAAGRILGERLPMVLAVAIAGAVLLTWPGVLSAAGGPTGYANTNATLAGLGALSAAGAALTSSGPVLRRAWWALGVVLGAVVPATGSVAGTVSLVVALGLVALAVLVRWPGLVVVGGTIVVSVVLGVTGAIASGGDPFGLGARAGIRADLWRGAVELAERQPLRGIGPGEFAARSAVSADADLRWAHSGYLQVLAEWGAMGFGLVAAVAVWVWARLWRTSAHRPVAACIGGAAAVLIGLHATVDYVFHVPAVLVAAAALVGWATSPHVSDHRAWSRIATNRTNRSQESWIRDGERS